MQPAPKDDLYQAEQAAEAARASHAAAVAKLDELRAAPGAEDIYQAEQAVEAARAGHAAAVARFDELQAVPGKDDVYQAGQAVEAAMAGHAAADETGPMAILPWSSQTVGPYQGKGVPRQAHKPAAQGIQAPRRGCGCDANAQVCYCAFARGLFACFI